MIIDIHGHLGNINFAPFWAADGDRLVAYLKESGIDRLCLSASRAIMYDIREGNAELDACLRKHDAFYGYVVVSPTFPDSVEDLKLLKSNRRFRGVKIHPDYHGYDLSVPSGFAFADKVLKKTPMALFHCSCMPGTGKSPLAAKGLPGNLWIDTAHYLLYAYPTVLQKMVDMCGADHVVFGTDAPLQGPMQMRFMKELVDSLDCSKADKARIFCGNAKRILGI